MPASSRSRSPRSPSPPTKFRRLLVEALEDRALLTLTPQLVADLNQTPLDIAVTDVQTDMVTLAGSAYFTGSDANIGLGLWESDGTTDGTSLVTAGSSIYGLTTFNNSVLFTTTAGLWKTNGMTVPTLLSNVKADLYFNKPVEVNGNLFFVAGHQLWKTDGSPQGTLLVKDLGANVSPSNSFVSISSLANFDGTLFFIGNDGQEKGTRVWKSDGTPDGTIVASDIDLGYTAVRHPTLLTVNGKLFLGAQNDSSSQFWCWSSPTTSPVLLQELPGFEGQMTAVGGTLFFYLGSDTASALWKSDGSVAGTVSVKPLSTASGLREVGGTLYFQGPHGLLWRSDGSSVGTFPLTSAAASPGQFPDLKGDLYFLQTVNSVPGLWKTDGTLAGTVLITALASGSSGQSNSDPLDGRLFFPAGDGTPTSVLWTSDGSAAGTHPVGAPGGRTGDALDPSHSQIATIGNINYFAASDGAHGEELWRTDATATGTDLVRDIVPGPASSRLSDLVVLNDKLYFLAYDATGQQALWTSDGTADGTVAVQSFPLGIWLASLHNINGNLVFIVGFAHVPGEDDPWSGLWRSDGTAGGAFRISTAIGPTPTFYAGPSGLSYYNVWNYSNCSVGDDCWDVEPLRTDGTSAGTYQLRELKPPGISSFEPSNFSSIGGTEFFFTSYYTTAGPQISLWTTDGTSAGTLLVTSFAPGTFGDASGAPSPSDFEHTLFFTRTNHAGATELWKSDGSASGTGLVTTLPLNPTAPNTLPYPIIRGNGQIFFWSDDGSGGLGLWTSDGTASATKLVLDPDSAPHFSGPATLITFGGIAYFVVNDGVHGRELWRSDGTAAGTFDVTDIAPGAASSDPAFLWNFAHAGPATPILLSADDGIHGRELWKLVDLNAAPSFQLGPDITATDTSGLNSIPAWAIAISPGAPDEAHQQLNFVVQTDDPSLFSVPPTIDSTGRLQFTPAVDHTGSAKVTVVLADDGGNSNGGTDQSSPQTFTINISLSLPLHNREMPPDVTHDGNVIAEDVIDVINYINATGSGPIHDSQFLKPNLAQAASNTQILYYDVTGDDYIAADDVVTVINFINAKPPRSAEAGQDSSIAALQNPSSEASSDAESLLLLLATDIAQPRKR